MKTKNGLALTYMSGTNAKVATGILLLLLVWLGFRADTSAQEPEPVLIIENVDDRHFPYVSATVAVSPPNAVSEDANPPVFIVKEEDGQPDEVISQTRTTLSAFRVVLALDVSYLTPEQADFDEVQKAAIAFVESLSLSDDEMVSLLTFGDKVQLREDFTNDVQVLTQQIAALRSAGRTTALNKVVEQAIDQLRDQTATRQAVVIVSNRYDNTAGQGLEDKCGPADEVRQIEPVVRQQKIPVFLIVFGMCSQPSRYEALLHSTGGGYEAIDRVEHVQSELESLSRRLQRAYRFTFLSEKPVDVEKLQEFTVSTTVADTQLTGQAEFVPRPGRLTLETSLREGQIVGGLTPITVTVTGPAPKATVSVSLDGEVLPVSVPKLETENPEQIGPHQLTGYITPTLPFTETVSRTMTVIAIDSVKNEATEIVRLNVVKPVQVSLLPITTPATSATGGWLQAQVEQWGPVGLSDCLTLGPNCLWTPTRIRVAGTTEFYNSSTITFTHAMTSLHPIKHEELLLDNQSIDGWSIISGTLLTETGYKTAQEPEFTVTLRAIDNFDQSGQAHFVIRRPEINNWLRHLFNGLVIVAGLLALYLIIKGSLAAYDYLFQRQRFKMRQEFIITLQNRGNESRRYRLWAMDPGEALEFDFDLAPTTGSQSRQIAQPRQADRSDTLTKPVSASYVAPSSSKAESPASQSTPAMSSAARSADWRNTGVGQVNQALQTLVGILPFSWASSLARPSQVLHQARIYETHAQQSARRVQQASTRFGDVVPSSGQTPDNPTPAEAQGQTSAQSSGNSSSQPPAASGRRPPIAERVQGRTGFSGEPDIETEMAQQPSLQPSPRGRGGKNAPQVQSPIPKLSGARPDHPAKDVTEFLEPGQKLEVMLHATPNDPYRVGRYRFTVHSEDFDHPAAAKLPAQTAEVSVPGISWFQRWLPVMQVLSVAAPLFLLLGLLTLEMIGWDVFGLLRQILLS